MTATEASDSPAITTTLFSFSCTALAYVNRLLTPCPPALGAQGGASRARQMIGVRAIHTYIYMYMYIYIYICIYVYVYVYTYTYIYICIYVCVCVCVCVCVYIYVYIYVTRPTGSVGRGAQGQ